MIDVKPESGCSGPPPRRTRERKVLMHDKTTKLNRQRNPLRHNHVRKKQPGIFSKNSLNRLLD